MADDDQFDMVDFDRDDSFRSVLALIWNFHDMEEPAGIPSAQCKTSLASIYGLMSETSPAFHLPVSPLVLSLLDNTNLALSKFLEDQTLHSFLPVPGRRHRRYYRTFSSFPGPYSVPPGVTSITLEKAIEARKRSFSLSASQVSSLETMLSGVCEVSSWLDWWLSACGGFREHLPVEVRADFERLILSGSRALEFLASQGCTALGNLVLSKRDSLFADVRSTVPAVEVARLRYSPLPETVALFPSSLLDSALTKMRAAANDALVQRTLHPPRIPQKPAATGGSAGSSASGSGQASSSGTRPAQEQTSSSLSGQSGKKRKSRKSNAPFSSSSGGSGRSGGKGKGAEKIRPDGTTLPVRVGGLSGSALETVAGNWSRALGSDRSPGRLPCSLLGLSSSPFLHSGIVSDVSGRLSSGSSIAARGRGNACQRSLRNRPRSGSRLLQSPFPGGEGLWWLETCDRSLTPERVRPADSVQDGNSRFCTVICQRGGFSSFPGSEGCVLSDPNPSVIEEAIEVHVGGDGLPVPSPVFRAVDRSPGLRSRVGVGTLSRDQTSPLSGPLVDSLLLGAGSQTGRPVAPLDLSHPQDCDKLEVGSRALTDCEVSRHDHRYRGRQGFSVCGASGEIPDSSRELLYHGRSPSSALAGDPWSPGFARVAGPSRSPSDAHSPVASEGALVPQVRPSLSSGVFATGSETGLVLVDGEGPSVDRGSIRDTCSGSPPVFGRVFFGMGRSPSRSTCVRGVVQPGKVVAHQSSRNEGSFFRPSVIPRRCHRSSTSKGARFPGLCACWPATF